jgi:predicted ribosome quality control (RQC) complex YloA/Tae2 family protein
MINNYYTILKVCESLENLIGYQVRECFTQVKDEIMILFSDGYSDAYLRIDISPYFYSINIRDNFSRAKSSTADILQELVGEVLQSTRLLENNRIIIMEFQHSKLVIELFGGAKNNIYILSSKDKIINAVKNKKEYIYKIYEYPEIQSSSPRDFIDDTISRAMSRSELILPKAYVRDLLKSNNLNGSEISTTLDNFDRLIDHAYQIRNNCLNTVKFYLYKDENDGAILSLIELQEFDNPEIFDDVNKAITKRLSFSRRIAELETLKNEARKKLHRIRRKAASNVKMCEDTANLAPKEDEYRLFAELLMSSSNPKLKMGDSLSSQDWNGNDIKIPLDPKLNLIDNAAKYYKKSKNIKDTVAKKKEFYPKYKIKLEEIDILIDDFEKIESVKELKKFINLRIIGDKNTMKEFDERRESKFREFDLGDGYILYAGKNASNNDELTVKFAKPNDIWMHARGSAGSHTVLRSPNPKEAKPPKNILMAAAQITAYYSKQKNAKYVPVAYTQKKNVHKPKGAAPGAVVMSREDVVMAEPKLPAGAEE